MTEVQKQDILRLRSQGLTFTMISEKLNINRNTVKGFASRYEKKSTLIGKCLNCGSEIEQKPKTKTKQFCSDRCRYQYWNHRRKETQMGNQTIQCAHCNKTFQAHISAKRKYCSTACYINARYGEVTP